MWTDRLGYIACTLCVNGVSYMVEKHKRMYIILFRFCVFIVIIIYILRTL
jgi:hypothetical protein